MRAYIIRRILLMIPTLFIASLLVFFSIRLIPGDVVDLMMSEVQTVSVIDKTALERELGLDVPLLQQYGRWLGVWPQEDGKFSGLLQGNLGKSLRKRTPVLNDIIDRYPITIELSLLGMVFAQFIAFPVGIISGLRQDSPIDYLARSFAIICIAVPGFWIGTMVIVFPSIWWGYTPPIVYISFLEDPVENLKMFIMPAIVLGMALSGTQMREAFFMTYFSDRSTEGFCGQFGINRFSKADALLRHVHLSVDGKRFVRERILIIDSAILLEVAGTQMVIPPNTLCDIGPGVPHSWRGLPAGFLLPDGTRHSGESIMVFFYQEEVRGFETVVTPDLIEDPSNIENLRGELAFPKVTQEDVLRLPYIKNGELRYRE